MQAAACIKAISFHVHRERCVQFYFKLGKIDFPQS